MESDILSRVAHATSYLTSMIGESIGNLDKGVFIGMVRAAEKAAEKAEKAEKEKAEKEKT